MTERSFIRADLKLGAQGLILTAARLKTGWEVGKKSGRSRNAGPVNRCPQTHFPIIETSVRRQPKQKTPTTKASGKPLLDKRSPLLYMGAVNRPPGLA
jgi:hypothetical protein